MQILAIGQIKQIFWAKNAKLDRFTHHLDKQSEDNQHEQKNRHFTGQSGYA